MCKCKIKCTFTFYVYIKCANNGTFIVPFCHMHFCELSLLARL